MWTLRHSSGQLIHLLPDTTTTIGRKSCDLILEDSSVSHLQAKIFIKRNSSHDYTDNNKYSSKCIISNAGSKKRTKIISDKTIYLLPFTNYELQPNDKIRFSSKNEWVVSYKKISLLTCGDCLDQIKNLNSIITSIGGTVCTEWNERCNFYTTICKRVTPKFVTALAAGLPFVTLKYWEDFYRCCRNRKEFPDPSQYILKDWNHSDEFKDISLQPKIARRNLFDNMEFIFFSTNQIDLYGEIIQLAGGRPLMCAKYGFKDKYLLAKNTIIIACDDNQRTSNSCCGLSESDYQNICRLLVREKRKMVDEIEIVKALLLCSREKYCNTGFYKSNDQKKSKEVIKNLQDAEIKQEDSIRKDIPSGNQQFIEKLPKNTVKKKSTTPVKKNEINEEQLDAPTSTILKFPEAIIKLEKLTPNFISKFQHSDDISDVNEKPINRKRKSNSPNISRYRNPSPDTFAQEDDSSKSSDSNKQPISYNQPIIINDQLIPEKIILKTVNKKKRKTESKDSSTSRNDSKITTNVMVGSKSDTQSGRKEVKSRSDKQSTIILISDDPDDTTVNNSKVSRVSKQKQQFIKEKTSAEPMPIKIDHFNRVSHYLRGEKVPLISEKRQQLIEEQIPRKSMSVKNENQVSGDRHEKELLNEEVQPFIKEKTPEKSIESKDKLLELYDPHKEKTSTKNVPIPQRLKHPSESRFISYLDNYKAKSGSNHYRIQEEMNMKYPTEDSKTRQKKAIINSFFDVENRKQSVQPNKNNQKLSFFVNSENDDNEVPSFLLKQRQKAS